MHQGSSLLLRTKLHCAAVQAVCCVSDDNKVEICTSTLLLQCIRRPRDQRRPRWQYPAVLAAATVAAAGGHPIWRSTTGPARCSAAAASACPVAPRSSAGKPRRPGAAAAAPRRRRLWGFAARLAAAASSRRAGSSGQVFRAAAAGREGFSGQLRGEAAGHHRADARRGAAAAGRRHRAPGRRLAGDHCAAFFGSTALLLSQHCCSGQAAIAATTLSRQGPAPVQVLPGCKAGFEKRSLAPISSKTTLKITTADCMWLPPAQSADFVIASLSAGCELRRVPCGGLHRPFALRLGSSADYTFVFHKGDRLHIHRSAPQAALKCR